MTTYVPKVVIQKEQWAQCENPNCNKWRRLPRGAPPIDEDQPWYCYLNPDLDRNTCSASEVEYDEQNEVLLKSAEEEAAYNQMVRERIEASLQAVSGRGRGKGRGRAHGKGVRGRGRPPSTSYGSGSFSDLKRPRTVSFVDDIDGSEEGKAPSVKVVAKQVCRQCQRLLSNQGSWEVTTREGELPTPPPIEVWEGIAAYTDEGATELACSAMDLVSSLRYFPTLQSADLALIKEAAEVSRLIALVASSNGLLETGGVVSQEERARFGLEKSVPLPVIGIKEENLVM